MNARWTIVAAAALLGCSGGASSRQDAARGGARTEVPACGYPTAAVAAAASLDEPPAPVAVAARGTPAIDGALSPGEWDGAGTIAFAATLPASVGGGTAPAELRFLHDDRSLYVSLRVAHPLPSETIFGTSLALELDQDCSGGLSAGDDGIVTSLGWAWPGYEARFADVHRWSCGDALCSSEDAAATVGGPGTTDGTGAGGGDATSIVLEMSHPLASGDVHDFRLAPGDAVAFRAFLRMIERSNEWPYGFGDTDLFPYGPLPVVALGAGATLRCPGAAPPPVEDPPPPADDPPPVEDPPRPPPPATIRIDVLPGSEENPVNLGQPGTIPVAILGDAGFDAARVDAATVRFAGAPVATTPEGRLIGFPEDVDGDGVLDLVLHFDVPSLALEPGATRAELDGLTCAGAAFTGADVVRTVP